jgi:hypothetical protein
MPSTRFAVAAVMSCVPQFAVNMSCKGNNSGDQYAVVLKLATSILECIHSTRSLKVVVLSVALCGHISATATVHVITITP